MSLDNTHGLYRDHATGQWKHLPRTPARYRLRAWWYFFRLELAERLERSKP